MFGGLFGRAASSEVIKESAVVEFDQAEWDSRQDIHEVSREVDLQDDLRVAEVIRQAAQDERDRNKSAGEFIERWQRKMREKYNLT